MAYSQGSLDQNLDSLGRSYVDGVTVRVASKYCVDYDLTEVDRLLKQPGPNVLRSDVHYDTSFEKKVLEDLKRKKNDEEQKNAARRLRIEKYDKEKAEELLKKHKEEEEKALNDERVRLEEIEKEKLARRAEEERLEAQRVKLEDEAGLRKKAEEEAEWSKFEEERWRTVKAGAPDPQQQQQSSSDDGGEEADTKEFATPPQEPVEPQPQPQPGRAEIHVVGRQEKQQEKINFSDFEALSDPFADLELKTMDDLAELRTILVSNHQPVASVSAAPSHNVYTAQRAPSGAYSPYYPVTSNYQTQPHFPPSFPPSAFSSAASSSSVNYSSMASSAQYSTASSAQYSISSSTPYTLSSSSTQQYSTTAPSTRYNVAASGAQYSKPGAVQYTTVPTIQHPTTPSSSHNTQHIMGPTPLAYSQLPPGTSPVYSPPYSQYPQYHPQYSSPSSYIRATTTSRSVSSDRRTEKLKDRDREGPAQTGDKLKPSPSVGDLISELQKESEVLAQNKTSRPNSRPQSRGSTGLENWVPWPKLEGETTSNSSDATVVDDSCLADLMDDEANSCRQLHEMGFPLSRLAKGCQAVGANHQKLINFCLVVDRLVDEGYPELEASHVAMLHNADEKMCRTHLQSFSHIADIGFPSKDVHEALIQHSFDHQKALDQLIT